MDLFQIELEKTKINYDKNFLNELRERKGTLEGEIFLVALKKMNELGFDEAIDYKSENIYTALKKKCPKGVDVYFDNVGGVILDAALSKLRMHAKVVICGAISQYNNKSKIDGPSNYLSFRLISLRKQINTHRD